MHVRVREQPILRRSVLMEKLGILLTSRLAAFIVAALLVLFYVWNPTVVQVLQLKTFDFLITSLEPKKSEEIIIVDFGEPSVKEFGQYPFDRRDVAKTIDKLKQNGAAVIAMPILFSEKDRAGGDNELAKALDGVIIAQTPTTQNIPPDAVRRGFAAIGPVNPADYVYRWNGGIRPIREHAEAAGGVGIVATVPEVDGVVRRIPLLVNTDGKARYSFNKQIGSIYCSSFAGACLCLEPYTCTGVTT